MADYLSDLKPNSDPNSRRKAHKLWRQRERDSLGRIHKCLESSEQGIGHFCLSPSTPDEGQAETERPFKDAIIA